MLVKDLRKIIDGLNDDTIVIMSSDAEGNSYSPLDDYSLSIYVPDSTYSGEIHRSALTPALRSLGYTEKDLYHGDDGQHAVVLWPTN